MINESSFRNIGFQNAAETLKVKLLEPNTGVTLTIFTLKNLSHLKTNLIKLGRSVCISTVGVHILNV